MASLRIDGEQRFTCASCARCCTRPWEIIVTPAEAASYGQKRVSRWFRERADGAEGADRDPFEPVAGAKGFQRIRKRTDGACGFLSPANRCRLHEELGERAKPLTCRLFPFSLHPAGEIDTVTPSFSCPTIVANTGVAIAEGAITALRSEWFAAYPRTPGDLTLVRGRRIEPASLKILRVSLLQMLERTDASGAVDLRANVGRIANVMEDLSRPAVLRLEAAAFAEYLAITAPFAAKSDKAVTPRPPSWTGRLMQRGYFFVTAATQMQIAQKAVGGSMWGLRAKLIALLARYQWRRFIAHTVDVNAPELRAMVYHYLRANIQTLGTGRRPVVDELAVAIASLNSACDVAATRAAARDGDMTAEIFRAALVESSDVTHADYGALGRVLTLFAAGTESLHAFGQPRLPVPGSRRAET